MIDVKVIHPESRRMGRIKDALDFLSSAEFFRTIPLASEMEQIREFMFRISPDRRKTRYTELSKPDLPPFGESWIVRRRTQGNSIVIELDNRLYSRSHAGRDKFIGVEFGSTASTWTARKMFRFKYGPGKKQWVTVAEGSDWEHAESPAANVLEKTSAFIENVMIPRITDKFHSIVERRLNAA